MNLHDRVGDAIKPTYNKSHAEKNRDARCVTAVEVEKGLAQLTPQEAVNIVFSKFPNKAVREALSIFIKHAETQDELQEAQKRAMIFKNANESSLIDGVSKITMGLHSIIDDLETIITMSTSIESEHGEFFSPAESEMALRLVAKIDAFQSDYVTYIMNRTGKEK